MAHAGLTAYAILRGVTRSEPGEHLRLHLWLIPGCLLLPLATINLQAWTALPATFWVVYGVLFLSHVLYAVQHYREPERAHADLLYAIVQVHKDIQEELKSVGDEVEG